VPVLLGATWAHAGNGWVFSNAGGGFEYPLFLVVISIAVALLERPAPRSVPLASTRPV
jgi:putative oxidoreductase